MPGLATATYGVRDRVADFELPDLTGERHSLGELAGDWTLLVFTTTWCPYCVAEAPFLENEVAGRFCERGLEVVVVDAKEPPDVARQLPDRFGWTMPFLIDATGEVCERFAPKKEGLPPEVAVINAHFILDSELVIRFAEYLNMERFDVHATAVVEALEGLIGGGQA
ncbi:MAG: peroxiredoxin family protein [Solirubrobacterales bacterium]